MREVDKIFNSLLGGGKTDAYTFYDYIENQTTTGGFIRTGFTPDENTRVKTIFMPITMQTAWFLFNAGLNLNDEYSFNYTFSGATFIAYYCGVNRNLNYQTGTLNKILEVDFGRHYELSKDGAVYYTWDFDHINMNPRTQMTLLGATSPTRMGRTLIWDNGTLVRDYRPAVLNADGSAGMLDVINDVFYTSANGVNFTYGNW